MTHWTQLAGTDHSPRDYQHHDGWRLFYDQKAMTRGWVVSFEDNLIPREEVRNAELGPDDSHGAMVWADSVIGYGQDWTNKAIASEDEAVGRIM